MTIRASCSSSPGLLKSIGFFTVQRRGVSCFIFEFWRAAFAPCGSWTQRKYLGKSPTTNLCHNDRNPISGDITVSLFVPQIVLPTERSHIVGRNLQSLPEYPENINGVVIPRHHFNTRPVVQEVCSRVSKSARQASIRCTFTPNHGVFLFRG